MFVQNNKLRDVFLDTGEKNSKNCLRFLNKQMAYFKNVIQISEKLKEKYKIKCKNSKLKVAIQKFETGLRFYNFVITALIINECCRINGA
jgi:aspartate 1-decarboxylase